MFVIVVKKLLKNNGSLYYINIGSSSSSIIIIVVVVVEPLLLCKFLLMKIINQPSKRTRMILDISYYYGNKKGSMLNCTMVQLSHKCLPAWSDIHGTGGQKKKSLLNRRFCFLSISLD